MNYYPFHIGDYASHTRGLSLMEDLAYRRLIDEYYLSERPFNGCSTDVARHIGMAEQESSVSYVLNRYFVFQDNKWIHERIEKELDSFKSKQEKAVLAGRASAESRKNKGNRTDVQRTFNERSTTVQPTNNQEPITNNQEPITTHTDTVEISPVKPSLAAAVCVLLKSEGIGSVNPQNPTLVNLINGGADIGMFAEAARISKEKSKGFSYVLGIVKSQLSDALHLAENARDSPKTRTETNFQRSMRERVEEATGRRNPDDRNVIDITPSQNQTVRIA